VLRGRNLQRAQWWLTRQPRFVVLTLTTYVIMLFRVLDSMFSDVCFEISV
jgi:hypothetical protein